MADEITIGTVIEMTHAIPTPEGGPVEPDLRILAVVTDISGIGEGETIDIRIKWSDLAERIAYGFWSVSE